MLMSESIKIWISHDIIGEFFAKTDFCDCFWNFFHFVDFKDLSARISKRTLDGAKVSLEQMDQTDSIYVENLRSGITANFLNLYFENQAGDNTVKDVTMLSEGAAKVSFISCDCKSRDVSCVNYIFSAFFKVPLCIFHQPWASS